VKSVVSRWYLPDKVVLLMPRTLKKIQILQNSKPPPCVFRTVQTLNAVTGQVRIEKSMGSLGAMPMVVVNLGGEMVYVLRQRLAAQKIDHEKSRQVLNDVVGAMFNENLVHEIFKPHPLYSSEATKQIFQKLSHCSIMKLNDSSMSKLYELMTMVFKFQLLSTRDPSDILAISRLHMTNMKSYVDESAARLIQACEERFEESYGSLGKASLLKLKRTLLDFLLGKSTKISLLLQENFQDLDGRILRELNGPCPERIPVPGFARNYNAEGAIGKDYDIDLSLLKRYAIEEYEAAKYSGAHKLIGDNMYDIFRREDAATTSASEKEQEEKTATNEEQESEEKHSSAAEELNFLAELIEPMKKHGTSSLSLNLFGASSNDLVDECLRKREGKQSHDEDDDDDDEGEGVEHINFDSRKSHKSLTDRLKDLDIDECEEEGRRSMGTSKEADLSEDEDEDDDLLALLDEAKS